KLMYVVRGKVALHYNGERHLLTAGDSAYLDGGIPHSWENVGSGGARTLWVITGKEEEGGDGRDRGLLHRLTPEPAWPPRARRTGSSIAFGRRRPSSAAAPTSGRGSPPGLAACGRPTPSGGPGWKQPGSATRAT